MRVVLGNLFIFIALNAQTRRMVTQPYAPAPADPKQALDAVPAKPDAVKIIRNEQLKKVLNQRTTAFEANQMAIEKKRAERARTPAKVAPAEEET